MLLGTCSRAVVRCVLCALSGCVSPGGRCCLAPVRVPWLWPAACLSGVPRGPVWCAAPRPVRSLSVRLSAFPTLWCLSPPRGLSPPDLLGGCAGHVEAGREPGSLCLPLAPAEAGGGGGLAPRRTRSGPRDGVVPGGSLQRRSWAACAAVAGVRGPGHSSVRFPVPSIVRRGTRPMHRGCFGVDADTSPFGLEDATPGSRVCVRVLVLPGRVGGAGLPGAFWCATPLLWPLCPSALLGPLRPWVAPFLSFCLPSFFSLFFFLCAPPLYLAFSAFRPRVPWALALCVPFPPSPLLSFLLCAPAVSFFLWFPAQSAVGLGAVLSPPPLLTLVFFFFLASVFVSSRPPFPLPPPFFLPFSPGLLPPPPALVCFLSLPLLGSPCALAAFVFPAWPLAAPLWLCPPPPPLFCVFRGFRRCRSIFRVCPPLLCSCLLAWRSSAVLAGCCPPPPPPPGARVVPCAF